jgi:hypothetical protein
VSIDDWWLAAEWFVGSGGKFFYNYIVDLFVMHLPGVTGELLSLARSYLIQRWYSLNFITLPSGRNISNGYGDQNNALSGCGGNCKIGLGIQRD